MQRWTERQRAMLKALGVGSFWPLPAPGTSASGAPAPHMPDVSAPSAQAALQDNLSRQAAQPGTPSQPTAPPVHVTQRPSLPAAATLPIAPAGVSASMPRPHAATLDWPALTQAIHACQACGLCAQRKQAVVGVGHTQARWMLVGEAPGEQEDIRGEPFVGRAGQLLDRMLQASGLTRADASVEQQVYIANVIKCRPPGNRNPTPEEVQQCEPYLMRQVQLVQPRLIVAMGRFAAQALLKSNEPIGRLRGRIHDYEGTPVVVTYHPAYLLRNPADKALAWDDWCLAREWMSQHAG